MRSASTTSFPFASFRGECIHKFLSLNYIFFYKNHQPALQHYRTHQYNFQFNSTHSNSLEPKTTRQAYKPRARYRAVTARISSYWVLIIPRTQHPLHHQMSQFVSLPVPAHLWVCGQCYGPTLISKDPTHCPLDGHPRDYNVGCCKNPGDSCASGLFPDYPQYEHQHAHYPATQHVCGVSASLSNVGYHGDSGFVQRGYNDLWNCECGTEDNPDWHTECPVCGQPRPNSDGALASHFITSPGAGSPAQGGWTCGNCQCPNGILDDFCSSCGEPKSYSS